MQICAVGHIQMVLTMLREWTAEEYKIEDVIMLAVCHH